MTRNLKSYHAAPVVASILAVLLFFEYALYLFPDKIKLAELLGMDDFESQARNYLMIANISSVYMIPNTVTMVCCFVQYQLSKETKPDTPREIDEAEAAPAPAAPAPAPAANGSSPSSSASSASSSGASSPRQGAKEVEMKVMAEGGTAQTMSLNLGGDEEPQLNTENGKEFGEKADAWADREVVPPSETESSGMSNGNSMSPIVTENGTSAIALENSSEVPTNTEKPSVVKEGNSENAK